MSILPSINPRIVDGLYNEALVLADEVRSRFDAIRVALDADGSVDEDDRVTISCEALRTTNRMMHCMAWLLNHRAHFSGELSSLQLRRHGRLIDHFPTAEPRAMALLPQDLRDTIRATERLYERIARLDRAWRNLAPSAAPNAIERLRQRVSARLQATAG